MQGVSTSTIKLSSLPLQGLGPFTAAVKVSEPPECLGSAGCLRLQVNLHSGPVNYWVWQMTQSHPAHRATQWIHTRFVFVWIRSCFDVSTFPPKWIDIAFAREEKQDLIWMKALDSDRFDKWSSWASLHFFAFLIVNSVITGEDVAIAGFLAAGSLIYTQTMILFAFVCTLSKIITISLRSYFMSPRNNFWIMWDSLFGSSKASCVSRGWLWVLQNRKLEKDAERGVTIQQLLHVISRGQFWSTPRLLSMDFTQSFAEVGIHRNTGNWKWYDDVLWRMTPLQAVTLYRFVLFVVQFHLLDCHH